MTLLERLGSEALAHVRVGEESVVAKLAGDARVSTGENITLSAQPSACHVFDAEGRAIGALEPET